MAKWSKNTEEEIMLLIKDWLKHQGKTQKNLKESLHSDSERINSLLDSLSEEYASGGLPKLVNKLCSIEEAWIEGNTNKSLSRTDEDPFSQLDLLLEELKEDYPS